VNLSAGATATLAVVACVVAVVALLVAVGAQLRLTRVKRRYRVLWRDGTADVATVVARQDDRITALATRVDGLRREVVTSRDDVQQSLRHVAVVRYDAFGDMGGRLSFSAAIIDDGGDGIVLSSIHGRGESRTYAKGIVRGDSDITLTPEEQQALAAARTGEETNA
jgi:hypothetical protein